MRHWRRLGGDAGAISLDDARSVVDRMRAGDERARRAFEVYKSELAAGLANLVTFYNPSIIVLGGGLSRSRELYDGLTSLMDSSTLPATRGLCQIVQSALDSDSAAMGAAWLAFAETQEAPEAASLSAPSGAAAAVGRSQSAKCSLGGGGGSHSGERAIVCLGLTCMDSTVWVDAPPMPDTKTVAQRSLTRGGGNAANASVAASRLRVSALQPQSRAHRGSSGHGLADALM